MAKSFRDLVVFQRALDLVVTIYKVTEAFPRSELYGLTSQLRRASIGLISDLAESQGRLTFGEQRQLLSGARGSLFEIDAQCIAAQRLGFLAAGGYEHVIADLRKTGKALAGLIRWVRENEQATKKPSNRATQHPNQRSA